MDGLQGECTCYTTPVLCSIDDLEGYTFTMSDFQHPMDASHPLCIQDGWGVPNNPTWFAFVAWCTQVTVTFRLLGCDPFSGNLAGIQVAVYDGCGDAAGPIACDTAPQDCQPTDKTIDFGMEIGRIYYLVIDGCSGASCTVQIDVWGVCGMAFLGDWVTPIIGPDEICTGSAEMYYTAPVDGANYYHWFIDGVLVEEGEYLNSFSHVWNTPGTFELCVDVSSSVCVPVTEDPEPLCKLITVFQPEAGEIEALPSPACPNEGVFISASGEEPGSGYRNYIVVVDSTGRVVRVAQGNVTVYSYHGCGSFTAYSYNYYNNGTNFPPVPGSMFDPMACTCCDIDSTSFQITDTIKPELLNRPPDITVSCYDLVPPMTSIDWIDNCGAVSEVKSQAGSADICNGGTILRHWGYTDRCDNEISHVQLITVEPSPMAAFANLPGDTTLSCADIPSAFNPLAYSNGVAGSCGINGSVPPVVESDFDACGGNIVVLWEFTDACGRTISHSQFIEVEPASSAMWVDPPGDVIVACGLWPGQIPDLSYTNGLSGNCAISGMIPGVQTAYDVCAGVATWEWEFTDVCGNTITHVSNVSTDPMGEMSFINAPSETTLTCEQVAVDTVVASLEYSNNGAGACLFAGKVAGTQSGSWDACGGLLQRRWEVTDPCGREFVHLQTITVLAAPSPGYLELPADITMECVEMPHDPPLLFISNGISSGPCAMLDSTTSLVQGTYTFCGGALNYTWEWNGPCGEILTHVQNVTVLPAPSPVFSSGTLPLTVEIDEIENIQTKLEYTNSLTGSCAVSDSVEAVVTSAYDPCGGTITFSWSAVDACGNAIYHVHETEVLAADVIIDAGPDQLLDCATSNAMLYMTSNIPGEASWMDPDGVIIPSATLIATRPGVYIATISFSDECAFSDSVIVTLDPTLPAVSAGPDKVFDCKVSEAVLSAMVVTGGNNISYEWTDINNQVISTSGSFVVTAIGTYYVRIYDADADCWSEKDEVVVIDVSAEPSAVIYADPGNVLSCVIEYIVMSSDKETNVRYTWISGGQTFSDSILQITMPGVVTLIATDTVTHCTSIDSIIVGALDEYPIIQIRPPSPLSCANPVVTLDASGSIPGMSTGLYFWTDLNGDTLGMSNTLDVQQGGSYVLTIIDPVNDCTSDDTVTVIDISVFPRIVDAPDVLLRCDENGGILNLVLADQIPAIDILWQTPDGGIIGADNEPELQFSGPGTYIVEVVHTLSQCRDLDTVVVTQVTDVPKAIAIESIPTSCVAVRDGILSLGLIQGGTPPFAIFIDGIQVSGAMVFHLSAGAHLVQIEDAYGCTFETTVFIPTGDEVVVDLEAMLTIKEGDTILLEAFVNIPPEAIGSVSWTPADHLSCDTCLSTLAFPQSSTSYTVVVTDTAGCVGTASVNLNVVRETRIFIPNVISPGNGDGINDLLAVYSNNQDTKIHSLRIFDRWGELVFERAEMFPPNIPSLGWDGTFKGKLVNPGVFVYRVEHETRPGIIEILTGDVTVVR